MCVRIGIEQISIHPPRVGRDSSPSKASSKSWHFNPPSPCGEGRAPLPRTKARYNFNPPSPCGEGQSVRSGHFVALDISIHPPRVGRDSCAASSRSIWDRNFNPPSPCGEGPDFPVKAYKLSEFQSTLPVWGGTSSSVRLCRFNSYFNPPSPCGEGQQKLTKILCKLLR